MKDTIIIDGIKYEKVVVTPESKWYSKGDLGSIPVGTKIRFSNNIKGIVIIGDSSIAEHCVYQDKAIILTHNSYGDSWWAIDDCYIKSYLFEIIGGTL